MIFYQNVVAPFLGKSCTRGGLDRCQGRRRRDSRLSLLNYIWIVHLCDRNSHLDHRDPFVCKNTTLQKVAHSSLNGDFHRATITPTSLIRFWYSQLGEGRLYERMFHFDSRFLLADIRSNKSMSARCWTFASLIVMRDGSWVQYGKFLHVHRSEEHTSELQSRQ